MGFMDKVKAGAEQAAAKAQQGMKQGQEKIGEMQAKRAADALLRELGSAYYAQQRSGGSADAVSAALSAVDAHVAEHGPLGEPAEPAAAAPPPPPPPPPPPAS